MTALAVAALLNAAALIIFVNAIARMRRFLMWEIGELRGRVARLEREQGIR